MNRRKWMISLSAVILVALMATGYLAIAAEYGSKDDPLVTLSYINDVLAPETTKKIDDAFNAKKTEFDATVTEKMKALNDEIDKKISAWAGSGDSALIQAVADEVIKQLGGSTAGGGTSWEVVKIAKGKTLTAEVGCEILLRIGSATCVASGSPGLINLSSGMDLAAGKALEANNLYLVTVKGRGLKATSDITILVNGTYTIN